MSSAGGTPHKLFRITFAYCVPPNCRQSERPAPPTSMTVSPSSDAKAKRARCDGRRLQTKLSKELRLGSYPRRSHRASAGARCPSDCQPFWQLAVPGVAEVTSPAGITCRPDWQNATPKQLRSLEQTRNTCQGGLSNPRDGQGKKLGITIIWALEPAFAGRNRAGSGDLNLTESNHGLSLCLAFPQVRPSTQRFTGSRKYTDRLEHWAHKPRSRFSQTQISQFDRFVRLFCAGSY